MQFLFCFISKIFTNCLLSLIITFTYFFFFFLTSWSKFSLIVCFLYWSPLCNFSFASSSGFSPIIFSYFKLLHLFFFFFGKWLSFIFLKLHIISLWLHHPNFHELFSFFSMKLYVFTLYLIIQISQIVFLFWSFLCNISIALSLILSKSASFF